MSFYPILRICGMKSDTLLDMAWKEHETNIIWKSRELKQVEAIWDGLQEVLQGQRQFQEEVAFIPHFRIQSAA